jgi:hypothetical protein
MRQMTPIAVSAALCFGLTVLSQAQAPLFEVAPSIPMGGGTGGLTLADLNGDGHLDLLVDRVQSGIELRFGNGHGQFSPAAGGPLALGIDPGPQRSATLPLMATLTWWRRIKTATTST